MPIKHLVLRHILTAATIVLVLVLVVARGASAQHSSPNPPPKRSNWDGALELRSPVLETCPPLTTDMPIEVLVGYVGGDSVARNISLATADSLYRTLIYSDTLQQALRYLYIMKDWDPIRLFQWTGQTQSSPRVRYLTQTEYLRDLLAFRARVTYPDTQRTAVLCAADIIAHVRVTGTQTKIDTNAVFAKHATLATCTILDPIKGKRVPNCWIDSRTKARDRSPVSAVVPVVRAEGSQQTVPGACLQFEISPEWSLHGGKNKPGYPGVIRRVTPDSSLADGFAGNPGPWVQPDTEYFVFLQFRGLGTDSTLNSAGQLTKYNYATLFPVAWFGYTCSLYPVVNGTVYDPHNDFGFGTGLTSAQFAAALRTRISSITNT